MGNAYMSATKNVLKWKGKITTVLGQIRTRHISYLAAFVVVAFLHFIFLVVRFVAHLCCVRRLNSLLARSQFSEISHTNWNPNWSECMPYAVCMRLHTISRLHMCMCLYVCTIRAVYSLCQLPVYFVASLFQFFFSCVHAVYLFHTNFK